MKLDRRALRGITLWQPMAWAVWKGLKPLENRSFRPWSGVTHVAIHAGLKWHEEHARQIREYLEIDVPDRSDPQIVHGAVIAVAKIGKIWTEDDAEIDTQRWFSGPLGWSLLDLTQLDPIPCVGAQGLWYLPPNVLEQINAQLEAR